ncbi:Nucleosome assembly protein 1 [Nymphaea thermarum]|nr:Nucleosome assembly protein 1 [Nymphaea thermarum]
MVYQRGHAAPVPPELGEEIERDGYGSGRSTDGGRDFLEQGFRWWWSEGQQTLKQGNQVQERLVVGLLGMEADRPLHHHAILPEVNEIGTETLANTLELVGSNIVSCDNEHLAILVQQLAKLLVSQHDELETIFFEKTTALEGKYQKLYQPLYAKSLIGYGNVTGVVHAESAKSESLEENASDDKTSTSMLISYCAYFYEVFTFLVNKLNQHSSDIVEKGVPTLRDNEVLADEITKRDEGALKYLKDIRWSRIDDPKGFKLELFFDTNTSTTLLNGILGRPQKILKKKPKKGSKNAKHIIKTEDCESFFNFFSPPQAPEDVDDIDEDIAERLHNLMEQDYDIGHGPIGHGPT